MHSCIFQCIENKDKGKKNKNLGNFSKNLGFFDKNVIQNISGGVPRSGTTLNPENWAKTHSAIPIRYATVPLDEVMRQLFRTQAFYIIFFKNDFML